MQTLVELLERFKAIQIHDFMIASMAVIAVTSVIAGASHAISHIIAAVVVAAVLDYGIIRFLKQKNYFPKSAVITGFLVALVMEPSNLLYAAAASVIAILSKHIIVYDNRHAFNPASFGLVASTLVFNASDSWWASSNLLVIPLALLVSWKLNKLRLTLSFLAVNAVLTAVYFGAAAVASLQGAFNVLSFLFFAGFMLVEPLTSTYKPNAMLAQGVLVALVTWAIVFFIPSLAGAADALLLTLLASNLLVPALNEKLG